MPTQEYISLINVNVQENKWRTYTLQVIFPAADSIIYSVVCSWGRLNRYRRSLTLTFDSEKEMKKFLESTLKKRWKNGYQIIDRSEDFPESPTLLLIPETDNVAGQMTLF